MEEKRARADPLRPCLSGLMGTVESVPAKYTFKYMLSYNATGLNNAMTGAGDRLLAVRA